MPVTADRTRGPAHAWHRQTSESICVPEAHPQTPAGPCLHTERKEASFETSRALALSSLLSAVPRPPSRTQWGPGGRAAGRKSLCAWGHISPGLAGGLWAPGKSALGCSAGRTQVQLSGLKETSGWPWPPSRMRPRRQTVLPAEVAHPGGFHKTIRVAWGLAATAYEARGLKDPSRPHLKSLLGRAGPCSEQLLTLPLTRKGTEVLLGRGQRCPQALPTQTTRFGARPEFPIGSQPEQGELLGPSRKAPWVPPPGTAEEAVSAARVPTGGGRGRGNATYLGHITAQPDHKSVNKVWARSPPGLENRNPGLARDETG